MKKFQEMGIMMSPNKNFSGDKLKMNKVLNKQIIIYDFKIVGSKFEGKCLHLSVGMNEEKHVLFTGSKVLMDMIEKVEQTDFPFSTTIVQKDEHFEFS